MKYFKLVILSCLLIIFNIFLIKPATADTIYTYSGTVTDSSGTPMSGIGVELNNPNGGVNDHITTGNDGTYVLHVPAGSYTLSVASQSYSANYPSFGETISNLAINGDTTQNFTLPVRTVTVTVVNSSGIAVPNATVSSTATTWNAFPLVDGYTSEINGSEGYTATANENGIVQLKLFDAASAVISVAPPSGSGLSSKSTTTAISGNASMTIQLPPLKYTYSGTVTDNSGNPLNNVSVTLTGSGGGTVKSGTDGSYSLEVAPGSYTLSVGTGSYTANYPSFSEVVYNLTVNENTTQNFILPIRTIEVTVVDSTGTTVTNAKVSASASSWNAFPLVDGYTSQTGGSEGFTGFTDNSGIVRVKMFDADSAVISVTPPTGSTLSSKSTTTPISGDASLTIQLPQTYTYNGVITDGAGNPLNNITVSLNGSGGKSAKSGSDGTYTMNVAAGTYTLSVGAGSYTTNYPSFSAVVYNYAVSGNTTQNFVLPLKALTITVLDTTGQPIPNARVSASASTWNAFPLVDGYTSQTSGSEGQVIFTDNSGVAHLKLFAADTVNVGVTPPTSYNLYNKASTLFDLSDNRDIVISYADNPPTTTAVLSPNPDLDGTYSDPVTVTLNATASSGQTITRIVYSLDGEPNQIYTSPFTVTGVGNHTLTYWSYDSSGSQGVHNTTTFIINNISHYNLSGKVYVDANQNGFQDSGENGYEGAVVTLDTNQTTATDANGNYNFNNLPAGTYVETLTLPNGYTATTTNPATVALNADSTQNFGIFSGPSFVTAIIPGGNTDGNFVADTAYSGGSVYTTSTAADTSGVTNSAPASVYQSVRYGNFSYTVSNLTPNASYTVRLHFNELYWNNAGARVFNVSANGQQVLSNYDIYAAAGGKDKAVVEQVPATADANGNVTLQFSTITDNAMVNGIEVYIGTLPSPSPTATPTPASSLSVNAGGASSGGFASDNGFDGGSVYTTSNGVDTSSVTNPAPTTVYQSVRFGNFSYILSNLQPSTNYLVRLHFNELYWSSAGQRVFNVSVNGQQVLGNFDIYQAAGGANKAVVEEVVKPSDATGKITVTFSSVVDNAMVNGIELQDASNIPTYTLSGVVYTDANQNGFQDTGENGLSGRTVTLDNGDSTTTDSNGNYSFTNLLSNSYSVHVVLPNGYTSTTQNPATVSLTSNTTQNFGLVQANYAINAGGSGIDTFLADQNFSGGGSYTTTNSVDTSGVTNPAPTAVYQSVRYGNFSYTIPNLTPNSTHTIRLHFNEFYWTNAGARVFNVSVGGTQVLSNYDIYTTAGGANKAVTEDVQGTSDANGNLQIQFTTVTDNAMVNGIELLN